MPFHPLPYFEIQKYYQIQPKFYSVYSRNKLSKIRNGTYITNLDEYESIGTHCAVLYFNAENVTDFDSFGVENIPKEIRKFNENEIIKRISIECNHTTQ